MGLNDEVIVIEAYDAKHAQDIFNSSYDFSKIRFITRID